MKQADEFVKNVSYSKLSTEASIFKDNLRRDFTLSYPKPEVMTTLISYNTVADFYCVYICTKIGFNMLEVLHTLASTPFVKKSGILLWKKVELPLFSELDRYTPKQIIVGKIATPTMMAAWEVFPKKSLPYNDIEKACKLSWEVKEMLWRNQNSTIADIKVCIIRLYRGQPEHFIYDGVEELYDTLFSRVQRG